MASKADKQALAKQRAKERAENAAKQILTAFEKGTVCEALAQTFLAAGGRHCDSYSWKNRLLVALAGYSDAMGYGAKDKSSGWLSVGRCVDKGQKAFYIWAPIIKKQENKKTGEMESKCYGFGTRAVYGLEQTVVIDAEKWAKHNKANEANEKFLSELPLRQVADTWGLRVSAYDGRRSMALGWYRKGEAIALGVENLATWAHELVHAADDRNGKLVERGQHWRSETVAELGGAILMYCLGYETDADLGGAWKYIEKYAQTAEMDTFKACLDVLDRTCDAVALILETAGIGCDRPMSQRKGDKAESGEQSDNAAASAAA